MRTTNKRVTIRFLSFVCQTVCDTYKKYCLPLTDFFFYSISFIVHVHPYPTLNALSYYVAGNLLYDDKEANRLLLYTYICNYYLTLLDMIQILLEIHNRSQTLCLHQIRYFGFINWLPPCSKFLCKVFVNAYFLYQNMVLKEVIIDQLTVIFSEALLQISWTILYLSSKASNAQAIIISQKQYYNFQNFVFFNSWVNLLYSLIPM